MRPIVCAAMILCCASTPVWGQSIGLYSTADCSSCNLDIPQYSIGTFYIRYMHPYAPVGSAQFRVVGLPPEWYLLSVTPNPAATVVLGDPFGAGTAIGFCCSQPAECADLFTVQVIALTDVSDVVLRVSQRLPSSDPNLQCPWVVFDCGPACDWWGCVAGGELFINSSQECTVGVQESTWSRAKQLYR